MCPYVCHLRAECIQIGFIAQIYLMRARLIDMKFRNKGIKYFWVRVFKLFKGRVNITCE